MASAFQRYEILLPTTFNDGRPVPEQLVATILELRARFGAESCESQTIHGNWRHQGAAYRDDLVRVFVDVPDDETHRPFFLEFKEKLKRRFEQINIWMISHPIEVI